MKSFTTGRLVTIAAILGAVIFVCVNIIASNTMRGARIDLTQQHLYSLSTGTQSLVGQIAEPIRFRFFMSSGLTREAPQIAAFASRVRAMLDSYVAASKGKIILEMIDPKPYSEEEDRAVAFGISPIQSSGGDRLFFGLAATNSTTGKATIGSFSPEREAFLEYDLTRLVAELDRKGKAVVALIDGMNLQGNPQMGLREQQVLVQMKQFFDVKLVQPDADLPADTRVLMVVQPQGLPEKTLFAIDQWVMNGGATLIFVDPNAESQIGPRGAPPADSSSDLPKLFEAWGVKFDSKLAVADPGFALQTERVINGRPASMSNLPWIAVQGEGLRKDDAILAQLSAMVMTTSGAFETSKPGVTLRPLVTASKKGGLLPAEQMKERTTDLRTLLVKIQPPANPPVIAARLTGTAESAYPKAPEGVVAKGEPLAKNTKPLNLILVGDADVLMDRTWVQRRNLLGTEVAQAFANNGDFVVNAIEQMAGGVLLADLRGRGVSWRPFERIQQIEQEANQRYRAKEQSLQEKLKDAEQKLQELGRGAQKGTEVLTREQVETIEKFRTEVLATREELRATQFDLRRDVDKLKNTIIAINVAGVPILVGIFALLLAFRRKKNRLPGKEA